LQKRALHVLRREFLHPLLLKSFNWQGREFMRREQREGGPPGSRPWPSAVAYLAEYS
jgi:hypothetical protein